MSLGTNIKAARKYKKITQQELSKKIGVSDNAISNWENDVSNPDVDKIIALCIALDVDPNYLLDYKNKNISYNKDSEIFDKIIKFLQVNKNYILK